MTRDLDLYAVERRAGAVVLGAGVWLVRACVLGKFRVVLLGLMVRRAWVLGRGVAGDAARRARWSA